MPHGSARGIQDRYGGGGGDGVPKLEVGDVLHRRWLVAAVVRRPEREGPRVGQVHLWVVDDVPGRWVFCVSDGLNVGQAGGAAGINCAVETFATTTYGNPLPICLRESRMPSWQIVDAAFYSESEREREEERERERERERRGGEQEKKTLPYTFLFFDPPKLPITRLWRSYW